MSVSIEPDPSRNHWSGLAGVVTRATNGAWSLARVDRVATASTFVIETGRGALYVDARLLEHHPRCFRAVGQVGFSYRTSGAVLDETAQQRLLATIEALTGEVPDLERELRRPPPARVIDPPTDHPRPPPEALEYLASPGRLPPDAVERFRRDGFVVLKGFIDPRLMALFVPHVTAALERHWTDDEQDDHALSHYRKTFVQITNVGLSDPWVRALSHAPRIARAVAELTGAPGIRLYCEDWLLKPAGEDGTGWHADSSVFPFEAPAGATVWFPMCPVGEDGARLRLARGSHLIGVDPGESITAEGDARLSKELADRDCELVTVPPFEPGDISIHDARVIHGSLANRTPQRRDVLALHMFADGARIVPCDTEVKRHQLRQFAPGLKVGDPAVSEAWPLLFPVPE